MLITAVSVYLNILLGSLIVSFWCIFIKCTVIANIYLYECMQISDATAIYCLLIACLTAGIFVLT